MDHGHHGGMPDDAGMKCNMNMLFTWDTTNLCIVFSSWRITGFWSLVWSLLAVIALTAGYEGVREGCRRYEARKTASIDNLPNGTSERDSLLRSGSVSAPRAEEGKIVSAAFYGVQVFYSFFIMLLFMTYNGWIMLAVGVGAFLGFLLFGRTSATKSAACH